jgi:hypothetical protein
VTARQLSIDESPSRVGEALAQPPRLFWLIPLGQEEHIPKFLADGVAPRRGDCAALVLEFPRLDGIHYRAIAKRFPVETIGSVEHHFAAKPRSVAVQADKISKIVARARTNRRLAALELEMV